MPIKIPVIIIFRNLYLYKFLSLVFSLTYTYTNSWVLHDIPQMLFPGEALSNKGRRIGSSKGRMHPPMPCHEFRMDKPIRGPAFGRYVHLKMRTSPHMRNMRLTISPVLHLKGITSLHPWDMRHLLLLIWEEIIHSPCITDPLPL